MAISKDKKSEKKFSPLSFQPSQRIRSRGIFKLIFEKGHSAKGRLINVWVYESKPEAEKKERPQLGIVVSRKTSGSAVVRNLWKRRLREAFRRRQVEIKSGAKVLLQARYIKETPSYKAIEKEMMILFEKAKVLK